MRRRRRRPVNVNVNTRRGPGLIGTMARTAVVAGTATATVKGVNKMTGGGQQQAAADAQQQQQLAEMQAQQAQLAQQQQQLAQQQAVAAQADDGADDFSKQLVQIQQLSALKDQGLLTEEEFAAKKAQILGI